MRSSVQLLGRVCHPPARVLARWSGAARLTVLCWHRIDEAPGPLSCSPAEFASALDALEAWGATVLPLAEAWDRVRTGTLPPRSVALTFDDGYLSTSTAAWPLLAARGMPATVFVVPGYLAADRYFPWDLRDGHPADVMTAEQVTALAAAGMDVGSHTRTHRWLHLVSDDDLVSELHGSRNDLEDLLGHQVRSLAYPAGHHDSRVRRAVAEAGYTSAYSTARGRSSVRTPSYEVRRTVVPRDAQDLVRVLDGAYAFLTPLDNLRERRLLLDVSGRLDPSHTEPPRPDVHGPSAPAP